MNKKYNETEKKAILEEYFTGQAVALYALSMDSPQHLLLLDQAISET